MNGNWKLVVLLTVIVGVSIWWNNDKEKDATIKPFWTETALVQVCKKPYYASSDCRKETVTLVNENTALINTQGTIITTYKITCYQSGSRIKFPFCRSWDANNQQWDFLPAWLNYENSL